MIGREWVIAASTPDRWRNAVRWSLLFLVAFALAAESRAHRLGDSYLYLQIYEDSVTGRFEIALSDLNQALGFTGTVRQITPENLDEKVDWLKSYYLEHVTISDGARPLAIEFGPHRLLGAKDGFLQLPFDLPGLGRVPERLTFDYSVLFDEEPRHRGFLLVEHNWATGTFANENRVSLVFSPGARRQVFDLTSTGRLRGFLALAELGAEHMLAGLDHIFFLVALLLPTVLRRDEGGWQAVAGLRPALWNVVRIVTAFLVAHALALSLAAVGLLRLPEALIETAIAASIVLAAAAILWPLFRRRVWWILFGLSLFHGLGFAGALEDLGVLEESLGLSVAAFNLGIEVGQLILVAILFPVFFVARGTKVYRQIALPAAAIGILLVAGVWVVERSLGVDVPMRELLPPAVQKVIP